ncbi:MAG: anti-anti-sigma factor [Pseudonocardiales bacterium]|nr:anti-anti-sigma factor [Jatrophihabitantaceae bacterium]MCW2603247.1 anti-anti-sigma factor [Pseudonocardiales bacterium]
MDIELSGSVVDGCAVLAIAGEVDVYTAPAFRDRLIEMVAVDPFVVVDLTGLAFIDSTGLGVLVAGRNLALEHGGAMAFVCTQDRVLKLLRITGLDSVFDVHAAVDGAIAGLRAAR